MSRRLPLVNCNCARCGAPFQRHSKRLRRGGPIYCSRSCSSRRPGQNRTHGATQTPVYKAWKTMKDRCGNPKAKDYPRYGGRGIAVCKRWLSFENFSADMGPRPDGHSVEREDNNGNYEPANCRWATALEQSRNRRFCFTSEQDETIRRAFSEGKSIDEMAAAIGKTVGSVYSRARRLGLTFNRGNRDISRAATTNSPS